MPCATHNTGLEHFAPYHDLNGQTTSPGFLIYLPVVEPYRYDGKNPPARIAWHELGLSLRLSSRQLHRY